MGLLALLTALLSAGHAEEEARTELAGLPALGYSTDTGLGLGLLGNLARISPPADPYRWKLYALAKGNITRGLGGEVTLTSYSGALEIDRPGLLDGRLRLYARLNAARGFDLAYYGLGNQNVATEPWLDEVPGSAAEATAQQYHRYERTYQELISRGRVRLYDDPQSPTRRRLEGVLSARALHHVLSTYPESQLAEDLAAASTEPVLSGQLLGTQPHVLLAVGTGLLWDTRDHELVPLHGGTSAVDLVGAAGVGEPLGYGQLRLEARRYQELLGPRLSLAGRLQLDAIVGDAPIYVLDGSGDGFTIRGVRARRYLGHIKALGCAEVRSGLLPFSLGRQHFVLGAAAFVDSGRVWTDWRPALVDGVSLDGPLWSLHTGLGGGARLQWGETFMIRFDRAASPSDATTGTYLAIGQAF